MISLGLMLTMVILFKIEYRVWLWVNFHFPPKVTIHFEGVWFGLITFNGFLIGMNLPFYNPIEMLIVASILGLVGGYFLHRLIWRVLKIWLLALYDRPISSKVWMSNPDNTKWLTQALKDNPQVTIVHKDKDNA